MNAQGPPQSIARHTLDCARFFMGKAEATGFDKRDEFGYFLEAAIVFARSVTFHLQKENAPKLGFEDWWATQQAKLNTPDDRFFLESRNFILHQGPLAIRVDVKVSDAIAVGFVDVVAQVIRGAP